MRHAEQTTLKGLEQMITVGWIILTKPPGILYILCRFTQGHISWALFHIKPKPEQKWKKKKPKKPTKNPTKTKRKMRQILDVVQFSPFHFPWKGENPSSLNSTCFNLHLWNICNNYHILLHFQIKWTSVGKRGTVFMHWQKNPLPTC